MARTKKAVATSPVHTAVNMDFFEALRMVHQGFKITRREWNDPAIYVYLTDHLKIHFSDRVADLIVSDGDMAGTDWFTV